MATAVVPNLCSREALDKELCERELRFFVEKGWRKIEPKPFVPGWHIDAICEHLEAISRGEIRNLIINVPPRHSKSLIVSVFWPAWEWGPKNNPGLRWLYSSYASDLSTRDSVKCRRVIQSRWYQEFWGDQFQLAGDQNAKIRYENTRGGYRLATSVDGAATGEGGDRIVVDDPNNVKKIWSKTVRDNANNWFDTVMTSRQDDVRTSSFVVIQQRSHEEDVTGHILARAEHDYELLVIPAEFEEKQRSTTWFRDPRKEEGELICPERFPRKEMETLKASLGPYAYAGQYQQRPSPREGGMFKRTSWKYYTEADRPKLEEFDFIVQSWDMTFKDLKSSDFVAGLTIGVKGALKYLLDQEHDRLSFTNTLKAVRQMKERWPDTITILIEDTANGPAVIDTLKDEIEGIVAVTPQEYGPKPARAAAVSPEVDPPCTVFLPSPSMAPWVEDFIEELAVFPNGPHDDYVDAFSQGILRIRKLRKRFDPLPPVESLTRVSPIAGV